MKYIILADNSIGFKTPKQLSIINNEPIAKRTIRLLKENNIKDIVITSHDKRFDNLGATRYEPLFNEYIPGEKGYWVNAYPIELLNEPICFLFGDVYYSENAIKTIINTQTDFILFFCSYENKSFNYIKKHDEPLAFKVVDYNCFKEHIQKVKDFKDSGEAPREPLNWELYRSINNQPLTEHKMTKNYIAINDESCDIDKLEDIKKINKIIGGKDMVKCEVTREFTLEQFDELQNIERAKLDTKGRLYVKDKFDCSKEMAEYLTGGNDKGVCVVKIIEVEPEKEETTELEEVSEEQVQAVAEAIVEEAEEQGKEVEEIVNEIVDEAKEEIPVLTEEELKEGAEEQAKMLIEDEPKIKLNKKKNKK